MKKNEEYMLEHAGLCRAADRLEPQMFDEYGVQRGLRDKNGNGVVAGLTNISRIESFKMEDGKKVPCEGKLWYRGYDCIELAMYGILALILLASGVIISDSRKWLIYFCSVSCRTVRN